MSSMKPSAAQTPVPAVASLDAWRRPGRLPIAKTLALMISLGFIWPSVAFAFEPATYPKSLIEEFRYTPLAANGQSIEIKPEWGRVTSSYQGASGKTVVYIQDLHCNYEVQSNIQAMLAELGRKNRLRVVGVEGESTPVNVDKLARIPLSPVKDKVGQYFLQRGRITGAEYQAATGAEPLVLQGIESQALYDHNQNTLMKFLNEESQGYCQDLRFALEQLKRPIYSTDLAKMDHERENFDQENQTLEKYCDFLLAEANRLGVELEPYKVIRLYALEHRLPVNAVVDYERLLHEAEALDRAVRQRLYTSDEQRQLDHQLYVLKIMENLINISATEEDLRYFRGHREDFTLESMLHFLENVSYRYALQPDLDPGVLKLVEYLDLSADFYRVADQRSQAFVENLMQAMRKNQTSLAVLITGGFHASHVENVLRTQGVSFLTVKPRLTRTDVANPYFSLLRNERTPLEKLLARNENIFAPRSLFNNPVFKRYLETVWEIELGRKLVLEDKLAGDALQQAFREARGNYPEDDAKVSLVFRPEQSNPAANVFVFQFDQEAGWYVVVRPNATTAYTTELSGEVLYGNNFQFQFVGADEFAQKRAQILGTEEPARAGAFALSRLAAQVAEVTNPITRALGTLAIAWGAPQGLRGLTPVSAARSLVAALARLFRPAATLWSVVTARMSGYFRPEQRLVERAMLWSLDKYGYAQNQVNRTELEVDLQNVLDLSKDDKTLQAFIAGRAERLALAGMAFRNGRLPLLGEVTPSDNLNRLVRDYNEAEELAEAVLAGTSLDSLDLKSAGSHLAQLVQAIRAGRRSFELGEQDVLSPERLLPEFTSDRQRDAMRQLAKQNNLKVQIPNFSFNPIVFFRPAQLQIASIRQGLLNFAQQLDADLLQGAELPMTAASQEIMAGSSAETPVEEEVAEAPVINLNISRKPDNALLGPAGAGTSALTLEQIMDRATPLGQVADNGQRQIVTDGLKLLGFQMRPDGRVILQTSQLVKRVQAAQRTLDQERRASNRRLNFLNRIAAPTPAQQQERFELQQRLQQYPNAAFELSEIMAAFKASGDKEFEVRLSGEMDALAHGQAFSEVQGNRMVLNAKALDQLKNNRGKMQLLRRLAHESGHIAGLEQTRIGEIRAGLIAKILAGYQLGIADYTAEIGNVNRRAILGETVELPLAAVGPASEIALTDGERETMSTWFNARGWTEVSIDTLATYTGGLSAGQLESLVPGRTTEKTHQDGVKLLAQLSQALAGMDSRFYSGADLLETFKLTLQGLSLDAAVTKHIQDLKTYAQDVVPAEFSAYETARAPIRTTDGVRELVRMAFDGEEGLALTPALTLMVERVASDEAAKFTEANYAVEFALNFDARAAAVLKDLPVALQPQARQLLQATLDKALASQPGTMAKLIDRKLQTQVPTPEAAIGALRDFGRFFRSNFQETGFADQADAVRNSLRRIGQDLLRQTASQQVIRLFGNKAPPSQEELSRFLPADYPLPFLADKLANDPRFQQIFSQYTSQAVWFLGNATKTQGYVTALKQLQDAANAAQSRREAIRGNLQQALDQIAWFFDTADWAEVEQMALALYRMQYARNLADSLKVPLEQVASDRSLASQTALAAELNIVADELAALRQAQGGQTASLARLAQAAHEQAVAALPQTRPLALVGPRRAGRVVEDEQKQLMAGVRQAFNTALQQYQSGKYQRTRLIELLDEAEQLMATLVNRYSDDPDVLALQGNLTEQKRLLVQTLNFEDFARRNPEYVKALDSLKQQVRDTTGTVGWSDFLTYAAASGQIVSRGGVPHATYSNPNADNIAQAQFAGYMRVAMINGQTVLCVDNGSSHYQRPGFRGAEAQFLAGIRGMRQALAALGFTQVALFPGHALEGMTRFDPSQIVGVIDLKNGQARASKDIATPVEIEGFEAVETRAADLQPESPAEYAEYIRSRAEAAANAVRPFLAKAEDAAAVEAYLRGLSPENFEVRTTERISGALAVHRQAGGKLQVIAERQLEGDLKKSTILHEAVEAALRSQGIAEAHALAFVVEQELAPESLRAKLSQTTHYDEVHLRNVVANTADVISAVDREPGGTPALKQRQKENALLVARVARSLLQEQQRVRALALDRRGFYGEETQSALSTLLAVFLNSQKELRDRLFKQIPGANTLQLARTLVQRGFDLLDQEQLNAFFASFGHKAETRAGLYTRQVLSEEINRLRRSLRGTVFENTLDQAQAAVQSLESGQGLTVKVNGQDRAITDLQIRKITSKASVSPEALKIGAFFTVEETPAGPVGFVNVMAHRQLPQALLHELLESVLGLDHRNVADLEAVSAYSLGTQPFLQSLAREIFWPTRVLSAIVGVIGILATLLAVGAIATGLVAPAAAVTLAGSGLVPLLWSVATFFKPRFIITVDGPDATGKTEIGEVLSRYFGYTYADAAIYYRAFALIVKDEIDKGNWTEDAFRAETPAEQQAFATFTKIVMDRLQQANVTVYFDRALGEQRMRVFLREGAFPGRRREVTDQVLPNAVNAAGEDFQRLESLASRLGRIPAVQKVVDDHLRALAKRENLVAVGQTMGTKLFDRDAKMRFYVVNNDLRNRAERLLKRPLRTEEELAAGLKEIENMDLSARTRSRDPLRPIPEAVVLDTGNFTLAEVLGTAQQSIIRKSRVVRSAIGRLWSMARERNRMLNRIQGENARRQMLEQAGDAWLGFSDIDGLSGYNLIYGKSITNFLLDDVLGIIEETANSRPVKLILEKKRQAVRRQLLGALLTLHFRQVFKLLPKLAETRVTTIRHGGDEGLYLMPENFTPQEIKEIMRLFRSRVQLNMHRQFMAYDLRGLKPQEEQQLRAIAAKINEDYGDPKLARVAFDEVYGVRLLLRVGRNDLAGRFQRELQGFAPVPADQVNGRLLEQIFKKRLEQAGLQTARLENLNLTKMAWPREAEDFKPPIDQKGYGYLQEGYFLTPTLSIGATKASRVDFAYVEKQAAGELSRSEVQAWSEALYQLAGDFLHVAKDAGKNQVVVDDLTKPIQAKEKKAEAPVLGDAHGRQLLRQQLLYEDNMILRSGDKPKHDAIYPKHFSTEGFRELVAQRLAVLAGRGDFQPEVHVSRAPPDSGPDKVHIAVITPETTYLLELEGQYYGPFVEQARGILRQRMAEEWSQQQQRPLEEVLADPVLERTLDETMASYVIATRDGVNYNRFKLVNDAIGYTAGDQMIGLPHLILDLNGLNLLRQPGRMNRKLPGVLSELEKEINDPQSGNQAHVVLTAVFSEMPTKQAAKRGLGRLFSDLRVASMAKQGKITAYQPTLRQPALVTQMGLAVTRLQGMFAEPGAQRRMVEEVEAAETAPRTRGFRPRSLFLMLFALIAAGFMAVSTPNVSAWAQGAQPNIRVDTEQVELIKKAPATRSYSLALEGRQQQLEVPVEAGDRAVSSHMTMTSPLGSHVALILEKTSADIDKFRAAKVRAQALVKKQLARLQGQEEPADPREINTWRSLDRTLSALNPGEVQLHAPVTLEGQELGAFLVNGRTYVPAGHLNDPELLAYDLVHENLHPAVRSAYGQIGDNAEENRVLKFGVDAFGSMLKVSLGFGETGLQISVHSIDPNLSADNPEIERAIQGALLAAWRQILEQKAQGQTVDQDFANALSLEMEKRGMPIPTQLEAKPGQGGFITAPLAGVLTGASAVVAGTTAIIATGTATLLTGGLVAAGILLILGMGAVITGLPTRTTLSKLAKVVNPAGFARLAKRVIDFIRGNPMIVLLAAIGIYSLLAQHPAEGGVIFAAAGMVVGPGDKKTQVENKVAALVRAHPELAAVVPQLTEALLRHQEHLKTANKFESLHAALKGLKDYDAAVIVQLIADRPQYFVHFVQVLENYQRKGGFADFAEVQLFIGQMNRMIQRTGQNAARLLSLLASNRQLAAIRDRGIEAVADMVDELGLDALSRLEQQIKESAQEQYFLAYESLQVARYLERIIDAATAPVLICENVAYGMFVTQPLKQHIQEYAAQKGKQVEFIRTRARSGMSHTNPPYIADRLFYREDADARMAPEDDITPQILRRLMTEAPHVVVLDGSKNQRYPDGFQQFSNLSVLLNSVLNPGLPSQDVLELSKKSRASHAEEALRDRNNRELLARLRELKPGATQVVYDVQYWTPDGRALPTRRDKIFDSLQRNYENFRERPGQREIILINATVNNASIPLWLRKFMAMDAPEMGRKDHRPGYFEDFYAFANKTFYARVQELFGKLRRQQPTREAEAVPALDPIRPDLNLSPAQVLNIFFDAMTAVLLTQRGAPVAVDERDGRTELLPTSKLLALLPEVERKMWEERLGQTYKGMLTDWTGTMEEKDIAQALQEGKYVGLATGRIMTASSMAKTIKQLQAYGATEQDLERLRIYGENGATKWQVRSGQPVEDAAYRRTLQPGDINLLEQLLASYPDKKVSEGQGYFNVSCRSRDKAFELARFITRQFPRLQRQYAMYVEGKDLRIYPWDVTKRRAAEDMAADLGIDTTELFLAGDSVGSIFDNDLPLVADSGFNVGSVRSPLWGVSVRRALNQPLNAMAATRALLARVRILRADEFQARPARAAPVASPLDGTPDEIRDFLERRLAWRGPHGAFVNDLMQALYSLGSPWRSQRMLRLTRAMIIAWLADRYSEVLPELSTVMDQFGLTEAERLFVLRSAEEHVLTTLSGEFFKDRPLETTLAYFWNRLLQTKEKRDAEIASVAQTASQPEGRTPRLGERGTASLSLVMGLAGGSFLAVGLGYLIYTAVFLGAGTAALFGAGAVLLGVGLLAGAAAFLSAFQKLRLRVAALRETAWPVLRRHLQRAVDFVRGNPMIILLAAIGIYALLNQQPAGGQFILAAGMVGGLGKDTIVRDRYKIPQRVSGQRRVEKLLSDGEPAALAVAEIDSFSDLKDIYGQDIAEFIYEKTLQILQGYLGRNIFFFRPENTSARFAIATKLRNDKEFSRLLQDVQSYLFYSFNRRYRVVTLQYFDLDNQARTISERDFNIRLSQLRNAVREFGHGAVGITEGRQVHVVYEISAQKDLQHALEVAGILQPSGTSADTLAAMPFEVESKIGLHAGYLYVPKLSMGVAGAEAYDKALAQVPTRQGEVRSQMPGRDLFRVLEKAATDALAAFARPLGGEIVFAVNLEQEANGQAQEAKEFISPEWSLLNFNIRNDQIFQRWFVNTAQRLASESDDKLAAIDALRQLYHDNQEALEDMDFDYLGVIFLNARQVIEEMRQMGHYALPDAERKFWEITLLWEQRHGGGMVDQYLDRHPELRPAMARLRRLIDPARREKEMERLREDLRSFADQVDLDMLVAPGRVKEPFSILMNFLRYWNKAMPAKPDFSDTDIYNERNVKKIVDDVVGTLLVIPHVDQIEKAVNQLIPYLEAHGYRIKVVDGQKAAGVNVSITQGADGRIKIEQITDGYFDVKIKIAPVDPMAFGAEIKILPNFLDESATRPGYTLVKQDVIKAVDWIITMGGPSGTGKIEAAWKLAQSLSYRVIDVGLVYRGIVSVYEKFLAAGKADSFEEFVKRAKFRLTAEGLTADYNRKGAAKETMAFNRNELAGETTESSELTVGAKIFRDQRQLLDTLVSRLVQNSAQKGRVIVVGQTPEQYVKRTDIRVYFDLTAKDRKSTEPQSRMPVPTDALIISPETQKSASRTVRMIEQMIADTIMSRGIVRQAVLGRKNGDYQALSLRNTLVVAAVWIGILSLGLGLPLLPSLGLGLLYPSAKLATAFRLLRAKYGFPGLLRHVGEPVGAYDPKIEKMVDPQTGAVLGEADWPIAWHEGFSHAAAQRLLRVFGINMASMPTGTFRYALVAGLAEFLTHTLDTLTAPMAFARLRTGPRWDAVVLSGVFLTSGLLLAASFFVALPAAVPVALGAVFALAGLSVAGFRGVLAPRAAEPADAETAAGTTAEAQPLQEIIATVRQDQNLGVTAQPGTTVWQRLRLRFVESGLGRAIIQMRGLPAGLKLMLLLPRPQNNFWGRAAVIGLSLAAWAGISLALVNGAGVNMAASFVLTGLTVLAPGFAFQYRLRTMAATPASRAIARSAWLEQIVLALNRSRDSVQVSLLLQELLGVLNEVKDDPVAREAVLDILSSLPSNQKNVTLQMADGSQFSRQLPMAVLEKPNLLIRFKRIFPVIKIDNQIWEAPQPRQRRAVDSAA
ncbi:MAG: (d)CMP kinase [candidate division FCPU426 bacterium]